MSKNRTNHEKDLGRAFITILIALVIFPIIMFLIHVFG